MFDEKRPYILYGTRGISHPRSGRVPVAGRPPNNKALHEAAGEGQAFRADGVVFGWRALRPHPVSCFVFVLGYVSLIPCAGISLTWYYHQTAALMCQGYDHELFECTEKSS